MPLKDEYQDLVVLTEAVIAPVDAEPRLVLSRKAWDVAAHPEMAKRFDEWFREIGIPMAREHVRRTGRPAAASREWDDFRCP